MTGHAIDSRAANCDRLELLLDRLEKQIELMSMETCGRCGILVADPALHMAWHEESET